MCSQAAIPTTITQHAYWCSRTTGMTAKHPDWVLMDLQRPHMGGLEATRRILAVDRTARVVIVTDDDDAHWRAAAIDAGACGYVVKEDLLGVRRLLESKDIS